MAVGTMRNTPLSSEGAWLLQGHEHGCSDVSVLVYCVADVR